MVSMIHPVLFDVGFVFFFFLIHLMYRSHSVSGGVFRGNCSVCLWEDMSSGASDVTILDWNSQLKNSHNLKVYMEKESKKEWIYVYVQLMHCAVHLKVTQHCKSTIFQFKKKI